MQDMRALKNPTNLSSWRAWQAQGHRRSGFIVILAGVFPALATTFIVACTLFSRTLPLRDLEVGFGLYLVAALGLMALAMLRLTAWQRANPWTPPT
jgi:high-affinity Fe2+/Pb2+ permease